MTPALLAGPVAMAAAVTNILAEPAVGTYYLIYEIHIVNKDVLARTFKLFLGATGAEVAGTEIVGFGTSIAVGAKFDKTWYGGLRQDNTKFLTGYASAATALTISVLGRKCYT